MIGRAWIANVIKDGVPAATRWPSTVFELMSAGAVAEDDGDAARRVVMGCALAMGPTGRLRLEEDAADDVEVPEAWLGELRTALAVSNAAGFVALASSTSPETLPATLAYWRNWARDFFRAACHTEEEPGVAWGALPPPAEDELATWVASAPPMVGLEFVTTERMRESWRSLAEHAADAATSHPGGPLAWLRRVNPLAHLVGKVTFHLAENKRDPDRPFAFLATFAHKLSAGAKPQHRPLAEALKQSVATGDLDQLERLLEPVRKATEQSPLAAELLRTKRLFAPQAWTAAEAYRFLQESPAMEAAGVVIRLPNWWSARRPPRPEVQVRIGERRPSAVGFDSLLDFHAAVVLDGTPLSPEELQQLLAESPGLTLLRGKWVEVDQRRLQEALAHWKAVSEGHPEGLEMLEAMRMLAGVAMSSTPVAADERVANWSTLVAGDWLRTMLERMRQPDETTGCQPGRDLRAILRPYQAEGVRWLWFMTELGLGACLADDMGLGKTIQVLDLLLQLKRAAGKTAVPPSLLVVPASLLGNWKQEALRFAPSLRVCFAHRSETSADELAERTLDPSSGFADFDLVVTSYGMARRQPWLNKVTWSLIILDEAQAIKNAGSAQAKALKKLPARRRLVMTGTPVENHLGELWSLFDFSSPGLLGTATEFKRYVSKLNQRQDGQGYAGLRRLVRPYILRRHKSDPAIAPDLPDKIEMRAECGLSIPQMVLYAKAVEELERQLHSAEGMKRRGLVLATLMQFKQICNHPAQYLLDEDFAPERSGKFLRLGQLCEPIIARQEKMLVFTQFQSLCQPLARFLESLFGQPGLVLHGGTPVKRRGELVRAFQNDPARPFFVISLKAGGSGLNLTAASHVVHFDRWWNPAVENQATDRAFRIGQQRNVLVHKFVCRGTIEERIDAMIADKREIAEQILDGDDIPKLSEMPDEELLKFVAIDLGRAGLDGAATDAATEKPSSRRGNRAKSDG